MIDREELASRLFVVMYERGRGIVGNPKADEIAAEALAASQTYASLACRQFGHVYGGEGVMRAHECARCGGDISSLVTADEAAFKASREASVRGVQQPFRPRRVYIGDCD